MVTHRFVVAGEHAGERLDAFLAARELPYTRSQLKRRIDEGEVTVNGEPARPSRKLRAGDVVAFAPPPAAPTELVPEAIPLAILWQDPHLVAVDKPAGLVVHPAAGHASGTLVHALLHHVRDLAGIGGELRPGIVHRLDRDTTGVLVVAKHDEAHAALAALFKRRDLDRRYLAIVAPPPRTGAGTIETLYGRHPRDRKRFTGRVREGKRAVTRWRVLERFGDLAALVECKLETGRTHQIRVHMAEAGHPVLGDRTYGRTPSDPRVRAVAARLGRQALHAARLAFRHPVTGEPVELEAPPPADFREAADRLRAVAGGPGAPTSPGRDP